MQSNEMLKMDATDQQLLSLLRKDARVPASPTLAHKLQVSRGTVTNRIARLEDAGHHRRLHRAPAPRRAAERDPRLDEHRGRGQRDARGDRQPARRARASPSCTTPTAAGTCSSACARPTSPSCRQVLERIRLVRGISSTETSIHLQTYRLS
jgi:DNA-binding Lrp family transcriptional regulator